MAQMEARQRRLDSIDVSDPRLYQDDAWREPFAELRREDPVHYCEASAFGPYWSVTRYDDIFAVELDHENYSSSSELGGIQIADQPKGLQRPNFIRMDPPGHTAQRRTVAPIVAPSNLVNLEGLIRRRTCDVLDALPRNEVFDWVERVSTELTNMMLVTLFGAGIHRCVGDRLAEQQLRILWEEILQRDLRFEIAGPPQRLYSNFIRGIRSLPVRIVN
jgi:cytochrome P450